MPTIKLRHGQKIEADPDERLVNALERNGVEILHRCGGYAKCTTCRVEVYEGEPDVMTEAEYNKLESQGLLGQVRLSCQILCDRDMTVEPIYTMEELNVSDPGPTPHEEITPEPEWIEVDELQRER